MYNRISQLFSALKPSPSSSNNNSSIKMQNNNSPSSNSHNNDEDDDEMSADLLSQQSPPPPPAPTSTTARPSFQSNVAVWNSSRKRSPVMKSNDNNTKEEEGGRPSFQSNVATCHSTNRDIHIAHDNNHNLTNNDSPTSRQQVVEQINNTKRPEEPWRNYGKSYARLSARNPANAATTTTTSNNDNDNNNANNAQEEVDDTTTKKRKTPPSSSKKKLHKLQRRFEEHHTTKLQQQLLLQQQQQQQQNDTSSSSSSHGSSTRNNDTSNNHHHHHHHNIRSATPPSSKVLSNYNQEEPLLPIAPPVVGGASIMRSPVGQEIKIFDHNTNNNNNNKKGIEGEKGEEEEEYYEEEFSPLTCPPSQPSWSQRDDFFRGSMDDDEEEGEGTEEGMGGGNNSDEKREQQQQRDNAKEEEVSDKFQSNEQDYESNNNNNSSSSKEAASSDPTLIKKYTAALKASASTNNNNATNNITTNNNNNNRRQQQQQQQQRGTKRKPTPLDLALIEESTKPTAGAATTNKESGRNKRRNKLLEAALATKDDSQTPPYELPTPRNEEGGGGMINENEEEEHDKKMQEEEDVSMGNDNDSEEEVNFFPSHDDDNDDEENETGTEKQSEALLSSSSLSVKQSEPLLSSPSSQPQEEAGVSTGAAAASNIADTAAAATETSEEITTDELVKNLREQCDFMGKALTCTICQASLREAQLLPCCHAFCKSCVAEMFNPNPHKGKKKKKGSPPRIAYKICPNCKHPADRRSVVPIPQLDEQVKAYKKILVAFGMAPYVYGEGIAMTQLDPEENGDKPLTEEQRLECLMASRTVNAVEARNLERAQAKAAATTQQQQQQSSENRTHHPLGKTRSALSSSQPRQQQRLTKEQMESQNELRRWEQVAKEQENVVKVNESALNQVKSGRAHQLVQRKMVQAETAKFLATVDNGVDESKPPAVNNKTVDDTTANERDNSDNDEVEFCTAPDSDSVEYDTAKESQGLSTTNTTAIADGGPSPMVINDGNTVKKAERTGAQHRTTSTISGSRVLDLEVSPEAAQKKMMMEGGRDSLGTVGTAGNASPIVLHDGNTVRKIRPGNKDENEKSSESIEDKTPRSSGNFLRCEGVAMKRASNEDMEESDEEESVYCAETQPLTRSAPLKSGSQDDDDGSEYAAETQPLIKRAPLKSGSQDDDGSEYAAETQPIIGKPASKPAPQPAVKPAPKLALPNPVAASASAANETTQREEQIVKGSVVMVQARTWPGINKHGGVGRVTKVHSSAASGGSAVQYDVSYVLGGKEKFVDESFVQLHKPMEEESSARVSSARKARKSSEKEVRRPKRTQQKVTFKEEVRIYNEEELKHIPAEALEWAGIVPKKGKAKKKAAGKKRALADSNSKSTSSGSSSKKQKTALATASKPKKAKSKKETVEAEEKESNAAEALIAMAHDSSATNLNEIISPLSNQEIVQYADERYSSLLSANGGMVLNVVTSNLSDEESEGLNTLSKLLKDKNVSLKLMKSFKANKTHLCITSAAVDKKSRPSNVVSNARTVKVMRSALAGLPILSPLWVNSCFSKGEIVTPTGDMTIRTLPRKQTDYDDECDDHFGVTKYAAAFQKGMQTNTLLSGVEVLLCGTFKGSMASDIKGLLQDAGATIISSVSAASRALSSKSSSEDATATSFVFLCDDSLLDRSCGISDSLYKQAKKVCDNSEDAKIMAVHFSWLFDCISCATVMPATSYEPSAPRAKALWRLAAGVEEAEEEEDLGKKSQFY